MLSGLWKLHKKAQLINLYTGIKVNAKRSKVSAQRRDLARSNAELRRVLTHNVYHVGRRQMAVMLFDHLRAGMAEVLADDDQRHSGHHREARPSVAQAMKPNRRTDPRVQTCLSHLRGMIRRPQGWPPSLRSKISSEARPAQSSRNSATPSLVRMMRLERPVLLIEMATVPESASKSRAWRRQSSPYRAPVASAACTSRRKAGSLALIRRRHSSIVKNRVRAASAPGNGRTRRQAASLGVRPSRQAKFSAALSCVRLRLADA